MDFDSTDVTAGECSSLGQGSHHTALNWDMCIICQSDSTEKLQCPAESKRSDVGAGYQSLIDILPKFQAVDALPSHMEIVLLREGTGLLNTLTSHKAKWHKSCRLQFYPRELERVTARRARCSASMPAEPCQVPYTSPMKRRCTRAVGKSSNMSNERDCNSTCLFCDKPQTGSELLHDVTTFELDHKVKDSAKKLCDDRLLAKLSAASDLIAMSAKYHLKCLATLYNRVRASDRKAHLFQQNDNDYIHGLVFAQLVSYIEEYRLNDDITPIFKLCDLVKMYTD